MVLTVLPDAFSIDAPFIGDLIHSLIGGAGEAKDEVMDLGRQESGDCMGYLELLGMKMLPRGNRTLSQVVMECSCSSKDADFRKVRVYIHSLTLLLAFVWPMLI